MLGFTPEEWRILGPLLDEALDLDEPARSDFLSQTCGPDEDLRGRLDSLIAAASISDGFLDGSDGGGALALIGAGLATETRLGPGARVGPYRILRELGHGGMGRVYMAERADGLWERQVALKVVRRDLPSAAILDRFIYERRILARLDHPNIALLLDGGATEDGQPYFAMELVEGLSIIEYCDEHRLPIEQRLDLFLHACDAVQYAHQNMVIHRDLKPSNIQIMGAGQVRLLDFGIAKLLDAPGEHAQPSIPQTQVGIHAMTPEYAAPEQLLGQTVTTATDVYSLGVLLYELLTGHRPYRFARQTPAEIERVVCGHQPVRPSAVVTQTETIHHADGTTNTVTPAEVAQARSVRPDRLQRRLRGDLELIVLRALQKDPEKRYQTADALARDVRNFRVGRPILARPEAVSYRLRRFVARNKAAVTAAALLLAVVGGGVWSTMWQASVASAEAAHAGNVKSVMLGLFDVFDPQTNPIDSLTGRDLLEAGVMRTETDLAGQPDTQAELFATFGAIYTRLSDYDRGLPLLERAIDLRRSSRPEGDSVLVSMMADLGSALTEKGEFARAESLYEESLAICERLYGSDSPQVTRGMAGLASVLRGMGKNEAAIAAYEEVLERDLDHFGEVHEFVAEDLGELANVYRQAGRPKEAEPYAREALVMRLAVSGPEHVETATAKNNLGIILLRQGDLEGADSLFRDVLEFDRRRFGDDHQYTATVKNNLAVILREKGDLEGAEDLFREVVDYDVEKLGRRHRYTPIAMRNLASVLTDRGGTTEAEALAREVLDTNRDLYGETHSSIGNSLALIASVETAQGRHAAAERDYRSGLAILDQVDPHHPDVATAALGLGEVLLARGRPRDALTPLRRALAIRQGGDAVATADVQVALGRALLALNRYDDAARELESAGQTFAAFGWPRKAHGPALEALADLYRQQGRSTDLRELQREWVRLSESR